MQQPDNKVESEIDQIVNNLVEKLKNIPVWVLEGLQKRAIEDAKKIFEKDEIKFEEVSYAIYRSYSLGVALGMENKNRFKKDEE